jgi:adenylate kinase
VAAKTPLGLEAKTLMDKGLLVSDSVVCGLVKDRIAKPDCKGGFILDGFPRTMPQAEALDELLRNLGRDLDVVFDLQVSDDQVLIDRMIGRAAEEGRSDDTPEAMERRLELYARETAPLVEYYRTRHANVVGLHAERTVDEVFQEVQHSLESVEARA